MALDFPANPTNGQTFSAGGSSWRFDGVKWAATASGLYLPLTGGTMTGPLILAGDPTAALGAASRQYVDRDVGRNLALNPYFNILQRGLGPFTTNVYTADRWLLALSGSDACSVTAVALTDADRIAISDERAQRGLQLVFTGAANGLSGLFHDIEGIRRLSGKTINVSFFAKALSGTPKVGIGWAQNFGTGGSPSASTTGTAAISPTIAAGIARYGPFPVTLPSANGKTLGTNNNDFSQISLWTSNGANDPRAAGLGVQSGTVVIWGVQIEPGTVMSALEDRDPGRDLRDCQRFFQYHSAINLFVTYGNVTGAVGFLEFPYPVTMRAVPTGAFANVSYSSTNSLAVNALLASHARIQAIMAAAGQGGVVFDLSLTADL